MRNERPGETSGMSSHRRPRALLATLVFAVALLAMAGTAVAKRRTAHVDIVSQSGAPEGEIPANTSYYTTIQEAVDHAYNGDFVLVEPGTYDEEVLVTKEHSGIFIRGMDRNSVIVDGQHKIGNGIEIHDANDTWVENLTVRNFEFGEGCEAESCGNEIWWDGGQGSEKVRYHGWFGRYLTTYDTGMAGGYGIFTNNMREGFWEHIYSKGFADSGMYLGACAECQARIYDATMEDNAVGYSGSNSGGSLLIEDSTFRDNSAGIVPNSENPGDGPPPQDGKCHNKRGRRTPHFTSTAIERCTVIKENLVTENNNLETPANSSTAKAPWGVGIELPGDYADLIEKNTITDNVNNGVLGFEYPNPFPPEADTIFFQLAGNKISENTFHGNGSSGKTFASDITLQGGLFGKGKSQSTMNCVSGNSLEDGTYPAEIENTWGCQNETTPNPNNGLESIDYLLELQAESEARTSVAPSAPAEQPTMPDPCEGIPANPLCPAE